VPVLNANQVVLLNKNDAADRMALFEVLNFSSGDTVELNPWFSAPKLAGLVVPVGAKAGAPSVSGTVLTVDGTPLQGLVGASGYLLVWGSKAPG